MQSDELQEWVDSLRAAQEAPGPAPASNSTPEGGSGVPVSQAAPEAFLEEAPSDDPLYLALLESE